MKKRSIMMLLILFFVGLISFAQEEKPFELDVSGSWSWAVKYGLGDPKGLALKGFANQLLLEGALAFDIDGRVRLDWPISGILEIQAQLDNQKSDNLQLLSMSFTAERLRAQFGDFGMGREGSPFAAPDRRVKGIQLDIPASPDLKVSGLLARVEGIKETLTFRGNASHNSIKFSFNVEDRPWQPQPYRLNLEGLQYYELQTYVEGFTKILIAFGRPTRLKELLSNYGLGYLFDTISDKPPKELESAQYVVVVRDEKFFLILKREALDILRDIIKDYIDDYNASQGLRGEAAKQYPMSEDTEYERGFVEQLLALTELRIDGLELQMKDFLNKRFYFLGREKIVEDSLRIELFVSGEFTDINDLPEYSYKLYADSGILEFNARKDFFDNPASVIAVEYDYAVSEGLYTLGLSVVRGSERVYLNETLLKRDTDYSMDYETGALMLQRELLETDVLRIEYELFRGGLGGFAEYKQNFSGVSFEYTPSAFASLTLDLFQTADSPDSSLSSEQLQTMPNTHTVWGLTGRLSTGNLQAALELGYDINVFPFDKNRRKNRPNRINVIKHIQLAGREYVLFGHQNGLTVFDGRTFSSFGIAAGLSGRGINDIAYREELIIFATDSGLSTLKIAPNEPLTSSMSKAGNWRRFYKEHGLASNTVYAVAISPDSLYVGTEAGLNKVPWEDLTKRESWRVYRKSTNPDMLSDRISKLLLVDGLIYVGTDQGLMLFDPDEESFKLSYELQGLAIYDILLQAETVYLATAGGIRALRAGQGMGWLVAGRAVRTLALEGGELWYGTDDGLYALEAMTGELLGRQITALAASPSGLWIGSQALWTYELTLWKRTETLLSYPQSRTGISGRDERRFEAISASENTDRGWTGRLSLEHTFDEAPLLGLKLGGLKLSGALEGVSPQFLALGRTARQDHLRLALKGSWPLTEHFSLEALHTMGLEGRARTPLGSMRDSLKINYSAGPQIKFSYDLEQIDNSREAGFDQIKSSYSTSLSERFLDERLIVSAGLNFTDFRDARRARRSYQDRLLNGHISLKPFDGLSVRLSYLSPLKTMPGADGRPRRDGAENLSYWLDFSRDFKPFVLSANWSRRSDRRIPTRISTIGDNARVDLRLSAFNLGPFKLTPRGGLSLKREESPARSLLAATFDGMLRAELGKLTSQISLKRLDSFDAKSQRKQLKDELLLRADYTGLEKLKGGADFQHSVDTLQHPAFGSKKTTRQQLNIRLSFENTLLEDNLTLSWQKIHSEREDTFTLSFRNTAVFELFELLTPTLEATGSFSKGRRFGKEIEQFEGEISLETNYQLSEDWSLSFEAGYLLGLDAKDKAGSYQSFIASLRIALIF